MLEYTLKNADLLIEQKKRTSKWLKTQIFDYLCIRKMITKWVFL